jgi:hypothetical protein
MTDDSFSSRNLFGKGTLMKRRCVPQIVHAKHRQDFENWHRLLVAYDSGNDDTTMEALAPDSKAKLPAQVPCRAANTCGEEGFGDS